MTVGASLRQQFMALRAPLRSGYRPKTAEPEPVIMAPRAPLERIRSRMAVITGLKAEMGASRELYNIDNIL